MSTFISAVQALLLEVSLMTVLHAAFGGLLVLFLVLLFKPLLLGVARALVLVVFPKRTKRALAARA